jgi:NAD(P)-dependent dehydrogenase (short-subunit alcohol dehydrogenase family)
MANKPVVLVTGASRGLGAAVARWMGKLGAATGLVGRTKDDLAAVAREVEALGGNALVLAADIGTAEACQGIVAATVKHFGRLDALINNAGVVEPLAPVAQVDPRHWIDSFGVNLFAPFIISQAAMPALRDSRGRIINVSSGAANTAIQAASAYCAAKAALNQFTRVLAAEETAVTILAVRPGVVDTGMQTVLRRKGPSQMPPEQSDYYRRLHATGALEPPVVPARAIAWLALHAPRNWSGGFLSYDDPAVSRPARAALGEGLEVGPG